MLVPLVITSFFECGTAAILGEGQGGLRGAVIRTFVAAAVMESLWWAFSALAYSHTIANWMLINAGNDFSLFGMLAKAVASPAERDLLIHKSRFALKSDKNRFAGML